MDQVFAVRKMQDYIEIHMEENIGIDVLAREVGYSPWYARKLFFQYVGITPADYIRKLRLRKSAMMLRDEKSKIIDAAMDAGFGSVDGFQRAFLREFGCNPKEYADNPVPIPLYTPYKVKFEKRSTKEMATNHIFLQIMEKKERKVIIKRGVTATEYMKYCEEVGCDVWGILTSMTPSGEEPVCLWLPEEYIAPGTSQYVQGVEVSMEYDGVIPDGFDVITLPASKFLMFQGEPFDEEDFEEAIREIRDAEKKYNPSWIGYAWDDSNPRVQLAPIGVRGYIELMPVKAL